MSQHLGHLPKSKSPPDSWWWWRCCPGATPNHQGIGSREALSQQQESGHMMERVRKLESWMKQLMSDGVSARSHEVRLEDPKAMPDQAGFREYSDGGAAGAPYGLTETPRSAPGYSTILAGCQVEMVYNLRFLRTSRSWLGSFASLVTSSFRSRLGPGRLISQSSQGTITKSCQRGLGRRICPARANVPSLSCQ